ncbi:MAG: ribonuclease P protein component [Vampirovibrionales bacterium]|nr:ribonuclease P protein component [Vampirovibrionales bacterium]
MLPQRCRLKSTSLFRQALAGRRLFVCDAFVVYGVTQREEGKQNLPRFGLIISRKTEKRAVRRNLIKRRMREIIRRELLAVHAARLARYRAIVIIMRPPALTKPFETLCALTLRAFTPRPGPVGDA